MDIVEFLNDRLAEDEAEVALMVEERDQERRWRRRRAANEPALQAALEVGIATPDTEFKAWPDNPGPIMIMGIDRAVREVEAKRAILAEVEARDDFNPQMWGMAQLPTRTLLALASTYADHPDYDSDWR